MLHRQITIPGFKQVWRLYDNESGKALADELCVYDEVVDDSKSHTIFDSNATWKTKTITDFTAKELLVPVFKDGVCVYNSPSLMQIQSYCKSELATLWDESKRLVNPNEVHVDLSPALFQLKNELIHGATK